MTTPQTFGGHFSDGVNGAPDEAMSSLDQDAQRWNGPHEFQPSSVLSQFRPSLNGMSERDASRALPYGEDGRPVLLPTGNGSSENTNEGDSTLRIIGSLPL